MLLLALLLASTDPRSLAVLEFNNKLVGEKIDTAYLTDQVRGAALDADSALRVMTRENLLTLLKASGKELADCEGECEVETGRRIGADLVISGELLKFGSSYKLDMRLHDTHEGSLLAAATASGTTVDELDRNLGAAVQKLLAPISGAPRPKAQVLESPTPPPARGLALTIENQESDSRFSFSLQHAGGTATCPNPIAEGQLCYLSGVAPGAVQVKASGTATFEQSLTIPETGGKLIVYKATHGLLYAGIVQVVAGGIFTALFPPQNALAANASGGTVAGGVTGFVLLGSGLIDVIVDLASSHDYHLIGPISP